MQISLKKVHDFIDDADSLYSPTLSSHEHDNEITKAFPHSRMAYLHFWLI